MKRARLTAIGWDDKLLVEDCDVPEPAGDAVVIAVEACGVCYRDCIDRDGRFKFIRVPITPGHEAVGRVIAVGPKVSAWQVGDRVASMHRGFCGACEACKAGQTSVCVAAASALGLIIDGGYATHLQAPASCFYRADDDMPAAHAAVLHCTFGTAYRGFKRAGSLSPGQRVLVTGANGGVGSAAIQVARRLGADVVAVVRDPAQAEFVTGCGAAEVIVDDGQKFHKQIGKRVDVALECVGEPTFNASLRSLRFGGRVVVIGNIVPTRASLNLGYVITRSVEIVGSSGANREDMAEVLALHRKAPLDIAIDRTMTLQQADDAQRAIRAGGLRGRVVLTP